MDLNKIRAILPKDYLDFLKTQTSDEMENDYNYINIWYEHELIQFNQEYGVQEFAPELFFIGSNGGGAGLAYDLKDNKLYSCAFIGMSKDEAELIAESFTEFLVKFDHEEIEIY